jgi:hypothetical protein
VAMVKTSTAIAVGVAAALLLWVVIKWAVIGYAATH